MDAEELTVLAADGTEIAVTRRRSAGRAVVFLHAGVADRRAWAGVTDALGDDGGEPLDLVAYDRRGYGETAAASNAADDAAGAAAGGAASFTHVDDLVAVLDELGLERVLLVGNSMGGALALDTALLYPEHVGAAVIIGSAVSGMTDDDTPFDWEMDDASAPLIERAEGSGADLDDKIAALAHLWLDGPAAPEGRVGGAARELFVSMNRRILEVGADGNAGDTGVDTWTRLGEITVPVLSVWGDLDVPADVPFYEETVRRLGQGPARVLPGVAHLPGLEQPAVVAALVREWVSAL